MRHIVGPASSGKVWPVFAFIQLSERLNSSFFAVFFALFPKKGILDYIAHLSVPQIRPLRKPLDYLSRLCFPRWHCDSRQHPHRWTFQGSYWGSNQTSKTQACMQGMELGYRKWFYTLRLIKAFSNSVGRHLPHKAIPRSKADVLDLTDVQTR